MNSGKAKFASDRVLWLLAAAMAIILFFAEKTTSWTLLLLISLAGLLVHPVRQLPGIRDTRKRQLIALFITACLIILFGFFVWPSKSSSSTRNLEFLAATLEKLGFILENAWVQRAALVIFGMIILALYQRCASAISVKKQFAIASSNATKGFLDHKMEAEDSMQQLLPVLGIITKIIGDVGEMMTKQTEHVVASAAGKTRTQVGVARKTAKMLNDYSRKLDRKCGNIERIGTSIAESTYGWLQWVSKRGNGKETAQVLVVPMQGMIKTLETSIQLTNQYLTTVESMRGVSKDLNIAVDTHLHSVRRIRNVSEQIKKSYSECLALFESN